MPILTLQQQQSQVGRIRLGDQQPTKGGRSRPARLDKFRFTTPNRTLAAAVAATYGGEVKKWEPESRPAEWEVYSTARELPVLVPPRPVSQWYEQWSGAGCTRRCDGITETMSGNACLCPVDPHERADAAGKGNACKITTRLNVMLPDLPGIGVWRLDSHGYYAAIELPGTAEFLGAATASNGYIKARLAIEERQVRRVGVGVRQFLVPALHVDVTPMELAAGQGMAIGGAPRQLDAAPQAALASAADDSAAMQQSAAEIAQRALAATTPDQVRALWNEAGERKLLEEMVPDAEDILEPLRSFLQSRGKALAVTATPEASADTLWEKVLEVAGEQGWTTEMTNKAFTEVTGVHVMDATAEHMQQFLDHVTSVVAA